MRKLIACLCILVCTMLLSGCLAILAGAGGTVLWQAGKVISEEDVSMAKAASVAEAVLKAEKIIVTDKVIKDEVTQLRGEDRTNKKVAVDVFSKGPRNVRIEIRYGLGEETPARELLNEIKRRL